MMNISRLDHLVLTVSNAGRTAEFYERVLGMKTITFAGGRVALRFGDSKINLHQASEEIPPVPVHPTPGSADLCFVTPSDPEDVVTHLQASGTEILEGQVQKVGALGPISSVYFLDPDGNLIEVASYDAAS